MMETEVFEQAISHIKLTFPKRIFEVCHLMKRETEAEFWGTDIKGVFSKQITLLRHDEAHVSLSLSVDDLTFEDNNLCFYVDKVKAKDDNALLTLLETSAGTRSSADGQSSATAGQADTPKRKRGRPKKSEQQNKGHQVESLSNLAKAAVAAISSATATDASASTSTELCDTRTTSASKEDVVIAPSGRRIRKPARFRELYKGLDDAIKEVDPDVVLSEESDVEYEGGDPEFKVSLPTQRLNEQDDNDEDDDDDGDDDNDDDDSDIPEEDEGIQSGLDPPTTESSTVHPVTSTSAITASTTANSYDSSVSATSAISAGLSIVQPKKKASSVAPRSKPITTTTQRSSVQAKKRSIATLSNKKSKKLRLNATRQHGSAGKKRPNYKREANIECRLCHHMYKDELSLIAHVTKLHPNEDTSAYIAELKEQAKVECKICGKVLGSRRNEMQSHMLRVHGEDDGFISKCDECGMEFKRTFLLKEHKRRIHPKHERILCHLCPASFKLKEYLTEHLKYTHNKTFKWQCDICHKMMSSPKNLRRHKKLHETAVYQCHICNKMFHESGNMRRHILYVHNADSVPRQACPHCERDFSTKNNLIQHINSVHMKTSAYYCDICKKYFDKKKQLIEHANMVHPGVPILSTKMDEGTLEPHSADNQIHTLSTVDHSQTVAISGVDASSGQATIIIQGPDGTEHVLVPQSLNQFTGVSELQSATAVSNAVVSESHLTNEMTQAINPTITIIDK